MKKIVLVLAVLMLAGPAFGDVTITAAQVGSTNEVTITYDAPGKLPRAFALDITVDNGQTIDDVTNFARGECDVPDKAKGYGIFPASFAREIDADDPNWAEPNYTPVAEQGDLSSDTQGGIDTNGITIEMGSLYEGPNKPASAGTLCSIWVSDDCNVSIAANVGRGEVVFEDGTPAPLNLIGCHVTTVVVCTVPDVVGDTNAVAQAAIVAAELVVGDITTAYQCGVGPGLVLSQNPNAGVEVTCGSSVNLVISLRCDGDLNDDCVVNSLDAGLMSYMLDELAVWGQVGRDSEHWDERYNLNGDDFINALDAGLHSDYLDTEGVWGQVPCPGPGI